MESKYKAFLVGLGLTLAACGQSGQHDDTSAKWIIVAAILLVFLFILWIFYYVSTRTFEEPVTDAVKVYWYTNADGFIPTVSSKSYAGKFISIDSESDRFAIVERQVPRMYRFDQLVSVDVAKNGTTLTKSDRGNQASRALLGGLLLGPVGLLAGGLSGSKTSVEKVTRLSLKVYTNDIIKPVEEIVFLSSRHGDDPNSWSVRSAAEELDQWYGRFLTMIHSKA